jgi:hypothetical protein
MLLFQQKVNIGSLGVAGYDEGTSKIYFYENRN